MFTKNKPILKPYFKYLHVKFNLNWGNKAAMETKEKNYVDKANDTQQSKREGNEHTGLTDSCTGNWNYAQTFHGSSST